MLRGGRSGGRMLAAVIAACALACPLLTCAPARAGEWMQVSCVNPKGTPAPSEGWTAATTNAQGDAAASAACAPGTPMTANLSSSIPQPVYANVSLTYAPPLGSTVAGGRLGLLLSGPGNGANATADASVQSPAAGTGYARLSCGSSLNDCSSQGAYYQGTYTLPGNLGGNVIVSAACAGTAGFTCGSGARNGSYALAEVSSADILLRNDTMPDAGAITGPAMRHTVSGTRRLVMALSDPLGPGIYNVEATVAGHTVYDATPDTNGGFCVPVGTDRTTKALMFDYEQPCPAAMTAYVPIKTTTVPDGPHVLEVSIADAAGNRSIVVDRLINTFNPLRTPRPRRGTRTRFALSWSWSGSSSQLRSSTVTGLPASAKVTLGCTGIGCPPLPQTALAVRTAAQRAQLLAQLHDRDFRSGDRLTFTVAVPHALEERIEVVVRTAERPSTRLLKSIKPPRPHKKTKHS